MTSGFDGAIYTWDINKYQETQAEFKKGGSSSPCLRYIYMIQIFSAVFYTNGLMRMRLTSDASKMVISTMNGLLCYSGSSDSCHTEQYSSRLPRRDPRPGPEYYV